MTEKSDAQLLRDYAEGGCESAFRELVERHTDFIYSSALRQVDSHDLARDLAQGVFTDLARKARPLAEKLHAGASLAGWLHRGTRYAALNHLRDSRRRQENERLAMEQLLTNSEATPDWELIRPALDEALDSLDDDDREALLLRYFKKRDFRAIGLALGVSDDTAQKRVSRAVERLREFFNKRGIAAGATGLVVVISANALEAAPAGLAASISTTALAGTTLVTTATTATTLQTLAMTTVQKIIVTCALAAAVGVAVYEARQNNHLSEQYQALQQKQAPLAGQIQQLQHERDAAKERAAVLTDKLAKAEKNPTEVVALRGQVGVLREEKASIASKSALSKISSDPETRKLIRDTQKMGMSMIYGDLAKRLNLTPELTGKFNDLLADDVMENIELITQSLHDNAGSAQIDKIFTAQEAALRNKLATLVGPDGVAQYQDYNKNLISTLTSVQFKGMLTGDDEAKAEKQKQLTQVVQEEMQTALAAAGLPPDFQAVPMLNFRNIASEEMADRNLKLMESVSDHVHLRANTFLNAEELTKLQEFWKTAVDQNRAALVMNRKMMAPIGK